MLIKKELAEIPVLRIPKLEKCEKSKNAYIAAVDKVNLPRSGEILVVDIFDRKSKKELIRFFSDGKNYLTCFEWPAQSWTEQNPRTQISGYSVDHKAGDVDVVKAFLRSERSWYSSGLLSLIDGFCSEKNAERRNREREQKRTLQDKHFAMFPPLPENLASYCEEHVFGHGYLFIAPKEKKGTREGCGRLCGEHLEADPGARSGRMTVCPKCGRVVMYRAMWNKNDVENKAKICIAAKVDGQLLLRWVEVYRTYAWPEFKCSYVFEDYAYNLHLNTPRGPVTYFYKYMPIPFQYCWDWYRGKNGDFCYDYSHVYTDNLKEVFGERYYNVDLQAGLAGKDTEIQFAVLLNKLKNNPAAEYLFKLNMPALAAKSDCLPNDVRSFSGVLGVSKQLLPLYSTMNVSLMEHKVIKAYGGWITPEELAAYRELGDLGKETDTVIQLLQQMSFGRFVRYFAKQREVNRKQRIGYLVTQYRDYIDMSMGLKVDLSHKSVRFPANCVEAHDKILPRFNEIKHEAENVLFAEKVKSLYANLRLTAFEKDGFCIVFPQLRSDLITEGQSLNHCVGGQGYYERHIAGTRMIFFVRKVENRSKPFFTMEVDMTDFRIRQLYGFGDCSAPPEVRKFAEAFVKKLAPSRTDRAAS